MVSIKNSTTAYSIKYSSVILYILFTFLLLSCDSRPEVENNTQPSDLSTHPVYSKYQFGQDENIIDFATQPLAIPTGSHAEAMGRDMVLNNLLKNTGRTLRLHSFSKGKDINFFMKRGDIELAVAGDMPTLSAAAENYAVAIALAKQNYSSIITEKLLKLSDLKGKRIGYTPDSSAHYLLLSALATVHLTEKDVIMIPLNINEMTSALEKGKIDAFAAWEPTPTIALKGSKSFKVLHKGITSSYLYCSKTFLERDPEAVKLLVASIARSMKWMTLSPDNVLKTSDWSMQAADNFSGRKNTLSRHDYAKLIEEGIVNIASSPIIPMSVLSDNGQIYNEFLFLQQAGKISPDITWSQTLKNFDRQIMAEVLNNPSKFLLTEYNFQE